MRRRLGFVLGYLGLALLLAAAVVYAAPAQQADEVVRFRITNPRLDLYKLALPPLSGDAEAGRRLAQVLSTDLSLSGLFRLLDPASFLEEPPGTGLGIEPERWRTVGAEGVLKARARLADGMLHVEVHLYEVLKGNSPVLLRFYHLPVDKLRQLGHRLAGDIVRFYTGEEPFFETQIAFSMPVPGGTEIAVMDWDGHGVRRVTDNHSKNILPSWHPQGTSLLCTSFQRGAPDLFGVPLGPDRPRLVSARSGLNTGGVYSPDGSKIALTLSRDGNPDIYLLNDRGDLIKRLTDSPFIDTSPAWSPDGRRLAFVSNRYGSPQLWTMAASGAGQAQLTHRGKYNQEPAWQPKVAGGAPLIAFSARDETGAYDIFTVNADSKELVRLTENRESNWHPSWAPNGRALAYASSRGGVWVGTADGKVERQVYGGAAEGPSWGPLATTTRRMP